MRAPGMCMSPRFVLELELDGGMMDGWWPERSAEQTPPPASLSPSQIGSAVDGCAGCWMTELAVG